jgi:hypothetical protein
VRGHGTNEQPIHRWRPGDDASGPAIADPRQPRVVSASANVTLVPAHLESVQVDDWHAAGPEA